MNTLTELKTAKASDGAVFSVTWSVGFLMQVFRSGLEGMSLVAGRYIAAWAVSGELLTQLWLTTLLPSLTAGRWVGPRTEWRLHPRYVSEHWCLFVDVCCGSYLFLIFSFFFFLPREDCVSWLWPFLGNFIYIIVLLLYYYYTVKIQSS